MMNAATINPETHDEKYLNSNIQKRLKSMRRALGIQQKEQSKKYLLKNTNQSKTIDRQRQKQYTLRKFISSIHSPKQNMIMEPSMMLDNSSKVQNQSNNLEQLQMELNTRYKTFLPSVRNSIMRENKKKKLTTQKNLSKKDEKSQTISYTNNQNVRQNRAHLEIQTVVSNFVANSPISIPNSSILSKYKPKVKPYHSYTPNIFTSKPQPQKQEMFPQIKSYRNLRQQILK